MTAVFATPPALCHIARMDSNNQKHFAHDARTSAALFGDRQ